ncbi:MAG: hypothetical protein ACLVHV_13775 [Oscillospiraceae bacterium]
MRLAIIYYKVFSQARIRQFMGNAGQAQFLAGCLVRCPGKFNRRRFGGAVDFCYGAGALFLGVRLAKFYF